MSKKEDKQLEELTKVTNELDDVLAQISSGKFVTEVEGLGSITFIEPDEAQRFEAQVFYNSTLKKLKDNPSVDLYDQTLLPAIIKKRCKEQGIRYAVVNQRGQLVKKVLQYMEGVYGEESTGENLDIVKYLECRGKALNEDEVDILSDIDLIDNIGAELKTQTYQHFAERTRTFFFMANCIFYGPDKPVFKLVEKQTTMFGPIWVVESADDSVQLNAGMIENIVIAFRSFIEGLAPDFLSALSAIRAAGKQLGQLQKSLGNLPSEDTPESGQKANES